ncbi:molybdenum cofactor guanylyltransferase MobA [Nitratireductor mangrovi]|uniref:Molybdenum cofactor guanylyltransferase n=1 Tax=Nitratireductor mangrovi TaxID=2599600 RepID=A0A5B8KW30_9HYPH|nr:molybdenum cofactor guanylyltransferase MobA [Nitratireductor mangrovi]QDY99761.1 molybdenum cofactor guanylyltransferase MobA [Nitratireductor mangrovi]
MADGVAGLVLAGGRSQRMGGADKAFLELGGQTLVARATARLRPQVAKTAISSNADPSLFADLKRPVLADFIPGHRGPLAGLHTGLVWAANEGFDSLASVATDTPFFPQDLVARMATARQSAGASIVLAASGGQLHPVFGLWRTELADELADFLSKADDLSVAAFCARHETAALEFAELETAAGKIDPFFNVNTPDDLDEVRRLARETQ